jgi:hypothetical protein
MINTLTVFAAGAAEGRGVARHAAPAAPSSPRAALSPGAAFVNGTPVRRFPVTAPLPARLRATFPLPTPVLYSP